MTFCPKCSHSLEEREINSHIRLLCPNCGFIFYRNPAPAVAAIIQDGPHILLVKRKFDPQAGKWTFPSGFIEWEEEPQECLLREVKEETNLDVEIESLFGVYSGNDDPRTRVVLIAYKVKKIGGIMKAGDDASAIAYYPLISLPEIAFKAHRQIIEDLRKKLS